MLTNYIKITFLLLVILMPLVSAAQQAAVAPTITKALMQDSVSKRSTKGNTPADTAVANQEPRYFYITAGTNIFVNAIGGFSKRFSPSIEFGRTYGIFDLGLAAGRFNTLSGGSDTTMFIEIRPTINIFSKGRFAEGLCLGGGYVFGAKQGLVTEICNSINFNISEISAIAIVQGYYFFDGTNSSRNTQYMGVNFTYNFLKKHGVNIRRKKAAILNDN